MYEKSKDGGAAVIVIILILLAIVLIGSFFVDNSTPLYDANKDFSPENEGYWEQQYSDGQRELDSQRQREREEDYKDNSYCVILGEYRRRYVECYAGYTQNAKNRAEAKARECNQSSTAVAGCSGPESIFY